MNRGALLLVAIAGCGADDMPVEPDARDIDAQVDADADASDAAPTACTPAATTAPPSADAPPTAGTYCVIWRELDGSDDPFPRYYDRAEVTLTGVHWTAEGGKGYDTTAQVASSCLQSASFVGPGGVGRSEPVSLCWRTASEAHGQLVWRDAPGFEPSHWSLCMYACAP